MANLVKCKTCGAEIAKSAKICPSCGAKQHKALLGCAGILLAIFFILIIVIVASSFAGGDPKLAGGTNNAEDSGTAQTVFGIGDHVELNDVVVTLVSVEESNGKDFYTPDAGKVYLICEFEIENNSKNDITVSSLISFEAYVDDYSTNMNISATMASDKNQLDGAVAVGKKMSGVIGYEADKDWSSIEIRFTPDFWSSKDIVFQYNR